MTWQQLINELYSHGLDALQLPAYIYIDADSDVNEGGLTEINGVYPYYLDYPSYEPSTPVDKDNCLMMTVADK